jgi:hypothetical protein
MQPLDSHCFRHSPPWPQQAPVEAAVYSVMPSLVSPEDEQGQRLPSPCTLHALTVDRLPPNDRQYFWGRSIAAKQFNFEGGYLSIEAIPSIRIETPAAKKLVQ